MESHKSPGHAAPPKLPAKPAPPELDERERHVAQLWKDHGQATFLPGHAFSDTWIERLDDNSPLGVPLHEAKTTEDGKYLYQTFSSGHSLHAKVNEHGHVVGAVHVGLPPFHKPKKD